MIELANIRNNAAAQLFPAKPAATGAAPSTERKSSELWLNIGVNVKGVDAAGNETTTFVALPNGIPLDDMKPQAVKGTNEGYIALTQAKNALLEALQQAGITLEPGQRVDATQLSVQLYRKAAPAQQGTAEGNPLLASMLSTLGLKPATGG